MRFDYDGCGNSVGDDLDPDRVASWLSSIEMAIERLKEAAGVSQVVVLGVRLGATLASIAASRRADVCGVIAVNPVVSGRLYLRELRFIQANSAIATPPDQTHLLENEGSFMDERVEAEVAALDLLKLNETPAPRVLVVNRDDLPRPAKWPQHLRAQGVLVDELEAAGYAEMMLPPHKTSLPEGIRVATTDWLRQLRSTLACEAMAPGKPFALSASTTFPHGSGKHLVREEALFFGATKSLFGIVSEPAHTVAEGSPLPLAADDKLIVLLSDGSNRLIGPNRIFVPLAHRWASQGHRVLRFDLAGIGESKPVPGEPDNVVYGSTAMDDVAEAIRFIQDRFGQRDVVLVGLCSGAYHSFQAAAAGMSVARAILINILVFFWEEGLSLDYPDEQIASDVAGEVVRYRKSMKSMGKWLELLGSLAGWRRLATVAVNYLAWNGGKLLRAVGRLLHIPLKKDLHSTLLRIAQRHIKLDFIFAHSEPGQLYMAEQAAGARARLLQSGAMTLNVIEDANHTFSTHKSRTKLMNALAQLIDKP